MNLLQMSLRHWEPSRYNWDDKYRHWMELLPGPLQPQGPRSCNWDKNEEIGWISCWCLFHHKDLVVANEVANNEIEHIYHHILLCCTHHYQVPISLQNIYYQNILFFIECRVVNEDGQKWCKSCFTKCPLKLTEPLYEKNSTWNINVNTLVAEYMLHFTP